MEKLYTIREFQQMIQELTDSLNAYKYLDAANGIREVRKMLETKRELENDS